MTAAATREALEHLEIALGAMSHPIANTRRDGLTDQRIDELVGSAGVVLPGQARELWKWRNGWRVDLGVAPDQGSLFPHNLPFLPLQDALVAYTEYRNVLMPIHQSPVLLDSLMPAFRFQMEFVSLDLDTGLDGNVAVVNWHADDPSTFHGDRELFSIESIPAMIGQAVDLYNSGTYVYDQVHGYIVPADPGQPWGQYWAF